MHIHLYYQNTGMFIFSTSLGLNYVGHIGDLCLFMILNFHCYLQYKYKNNTDITLTIRCQQPHNILNLIKLDVNLF